MGSDQSHHTRSGSSKDLADLSGGRDGAISPGRQDSVCSDSEVPYISYTVNRPIGGDSPKKKLTMGAGLTKRSVSVDQYTTKLGLRGSKANTLVVVSKGPSEASIKEEDSELVRLREIPSFLPIMRASLTSSATAMIKDPDILERLDFRGLYSLCQRYENHLRFCAAAVSTEQNDLCRHVKRVDEQAARVASDLSERQKRCSKMSDRIKEVDEMSKLVSKCHMLLNENIEQIEVLNNMLPVNERLEPFVWTTG